MEHGHDEKLEALLRARPYTPPRPDLARHIVLNAINPLREKRFFSFFGFFETVFDKPAYAFAVFLLLGFLTGVQYASTRSASGDYDSVQAMQAYIHLEEAMG